MSILETSTDMYSPVHHCFLADDLSGALEVGAVFHGQNRPVRISLRPGPLPEWEPEMIMGFDVDSRAKTSGHAYQSVFDLTKALQKEGHQFILKKIDSTMRGWIGAEIQAVLDSKGADAIALCPTNPTVGRTVEDGVLLVEGVPVHQTAFRRDPAFPIRYSRVDEFIRSQTDAPLRHCPLHVIRSSEESLTAWMTETVNSGFSILGFDAVTERDLDSIAQATLSSGSRILPCGSGAMAAAVGRVINSQIEGGSNAPEERPAIGRKRTAFLIGSAHPSSLAQFEHLRRARPLTVCRFDPNDPVSWPEALQNSARALEEGATALVPKSPEDGKRPTGTASGIQEYFRRFARITPPEELPRNWFITGGETAQTVIDALSLEYLNIVGELEPGVAVSRGSALTPPELIYTLITKPGGFGRPNTLIDCYDYFRDN